MVSTLLRHRLHQHSGFTLPEILVTVGIIGFLATITIMAVNPLRNLDNAYEAEMKSYMKEMLSAYNQMLIASETLSGAVTWQGEGIRYALRVCKTDAVAKAACLASAADTRVNMDALVPTYLVSLPVTPHNDPDSNFTGYYFYRQGDFRFFCVPKLDADCGSLLSI